MRILMAAVLLAGTSSLALADAPTKPRPTPTPATAPATGDAVKMAKGDCARARAMGKTCVLDIEGMEVEGGAATGGGSHVSIADFGKTGSLIRIRRDFIAEIIKSAEDI